jgi:hypothetical protein
MGFHGQPTLAGETSRSSMAAVAVSDPRNKVLTADDGVGNSGSADRAGDRYWISIARCHPGLVPNDRHNDLTEDQHREDCSDRHSLFSPRNDVGLHTTALEVNPKKCRLLSAKQKSVEMLSSNNQEAICA